MMRARRVGKAIMVDIGGVLVPDYLPAAAAAWGGRLRISPRAFLGALYGGSDDQVLVGQVSEPLWWRIVADRLQIGRQALTELQRDLASRQVWDGTLVSCLRRLRGRTGTAIVSNAWPSMRTRMQQVGLPAFVDEIVLSCEVGYAKPDARIYQIALRRLGSDPADVLVIDDTRAHIAAVQTLGMTGHLHAGTSGTIARIERFLQR